MTKKTKKQQVQLNSIEKQLDALDNTMHSKALVTMFCIGLASYRTIYYLLNFGSFDLSKEPDLELSENVVIPTKLIAYTLAVFSITAALYFGKELYFLKKQKNQLRQEQLQPTPKPTQSSTPTQEHKVKILSPKNLKLQAAKNTIFFIPQNTAKQSAKFDSRSLQNKF